MKPATKKVCVSAKLCPDGNLPKLKHKPEEISLAGWECDIGIDSDTTSTAHTLERSQWPQNERNRKRN